MDVGTGQDPNPKCKTCWGTESAYTDMECSTILTIQDCVKKNCKIKNAAQSSSHLLSRCQVIFEFCRNLIFLNFLAMWVLLHIEILSFVTIWLVTFRHNLSFWVLSQFEFLSFFRINFFPLKIWVLEFCRNLSFKFFFTIFFGKKKFVGRNKFLVNKVFLWKGHKVLSIVCSRMICWQCSTNKCCLL